MHSIKHYFFLIILSICTQVANAQVKSFTISGYVEDNNSSERLIGATVFEKTTQKATVTNEYGFFSLSLEEGIHEIHISYVGYKENIQTFDLQENITRNIQLSNSNAMEEITIVASDEPSIEERQMGKMTVPIEQLKAVPVILGEADVLKGLQLLPGVQSGGEAQTGLYVRGGGPDQNLMLLDGVPVYNASHMLGFFSVFNPDAIKSVSLTKGAFPARFGGRLSSVVDIRMKEGNLNDFSTEGSIGLISSKLTLQGPIRQGQTSFLLSGRRTYADLIARPFLTGKNEKPVFHFYDLNGKIQHKLNNKHRLYLSGYLGTDAFGFEDTYEGGRDRAQISWGNYISSLRWNWELGPKMFLNTTATLSNYQIDIFAQSEETYDGEKESHSTNYVSGIKDYGAKMDLDYIPSPEHYLKFGISTTHHTYRPGAITVKEIAEETAFDTLLNRDNVSSLEFDAYAEDEMKFGKLGLNVGVHGSAFAVPNKTYYSIQPRLGLNYKLRDNLSLKASYSEMAQYINLLTNESLSLPTDLWVPSTQNIKPQTSRQVALGFASTLKKGYEFSVEGYYKKMNNVLSYKEGAHFLFASDKSWEDKVTQGQGDSYGMEFFLQKNKGRLTGWVGYTLSWNNRQFDLINSGREFPYKFDRRHDISIVGNYKVSDGISLSANWIYGTGNAVTVNSFTQPVNYYNGSTFYTGSADSFTQKNTHRLSASHRLDFSISFHKKKKKFERSLVLGLYNAYGNKNPFMLTKNVERSNPGQEDKIVFKEISLLRFIPSISYNFKF